MSLCALAASRFERSRVSRRQRYEEAVLSIPGMRLCNFVLPEIPSQLRNVFLDAMDNFITAETYFHRVTMLTSRKSAWSKIRGKIVFSDWKRAKAKLRDFRSEMKISSRASKEIFTQRDISLSIQRRIFTKARVLSIAFFLACCIHRQDRESEGTKYVVIRPAGSYVGDSAGFTSATGVARQGASPEDTGSRALTEKCGSAGRSSFLHVRAMKANEGDSLVPSVEGSSDTGYVVDYESNIESEAAADDQQKVPRHIPRDRPSIHPSRFLDRPVSPLESVAVGQHEGG